MPSEHAANKELARKYFEEFDFGRLRPNDPRFSRLGELCSDEYRLRRVIDGELVEERLQLEEFQRRIAGIMFPTWSNVSYRVLDMIAEGDRVAVQLVITGVIAGEFRGIAGNNREVSFAGNNVVQIRDGKIVSEWVHEDFYGVLRQLGAL